MNATMNAKETDRSVRWAWRRGVAILAAAAVAVPVLCRASFAQTDTRDRLLGLAAEDPRLQLEVGRLGPSETEVLHGTYRVFENRRAKSGRTINLYLIVLPATGDDPAPDPVFVFHGGPGAPATAYLGRLAESWLRERRDIVLVDQRGTGRSNPLQVPMPDGDRDLQAYLDPAFRPEVFEAALPHLREIADLTQYTTPIAADDFNEVREALGYEQVNLRGGSYGSRMALVYMRRHPETVRTATLYGIAPIAFRNPLYHAAGAQEGWERLLEECESEPRYREAYADLDAKLQEILARLESEPERVFVRHPASGEEVEVTLTRDAFSEALRVMMYYMPTNRQVPLLVSRAHEGDYAPFAQTGLESNRNLRNMLYMGMLMCVVGSEDIPRIDPAEIDELTAETFLGDVRVHRQMAVAEIWPRGEVPANYGDPVDVDVPVLLWSGTHDPVTPPRWGDEAASHLPNVLHLTVPGVHGVGGPVVMGIEREFLERGRVDDLDLSGLDAMRLPPLALPSPSPNNRPR